MMSLCLLLVAAIGVLSSCSALPLCNGALFYSTMPCYYRTEPIPRAQRLMYVQYMRPVQGRVQAANDGVSTFVAADAIGAGVGAFVKGASQEQFEPQEHVYDVVDNQPREVFQPDVQGAVSIAEAYPAADNFVTERADDQILLNVALPEVPEYEDVHAISNEVDVDRKGKGPKDFDSSQEDDETTHSDELTERSVTVSPQIGSSSPHPVVVPTYIPPRKKIRVELEAPNDESDEHLYEPISPKAGRPQTQPTRPPPRQPQQSLPAGTFFPINFGGASGGAIAIANSFSTGEGGSATSHATAYGSPSGKSVSRKRTV